MAAVKKTESEKEQDYVHFQVDIGKLKYQMESLAIQSDRQEKKLDEVKFTLDKLSIVSTREFLDYKDAVNARLEAFDLRYVRVESIRGFKSIAYAVATALLIALVLALVRLTGAKL